MLQVCDQKLNYKSRVPKSGEVALSSTPSHHPSPHIYSRLPIIMWVALQLVYLATKSDTYAPLSKSCISKVQKSFLWHLRGTQWYCSNCRDSEMFILPSHSDWGPSMCQVLFVESTTEWSWPLCFKIWNSSRSVSPVWRWLMHQEVLPGCPREKVKFRFGLLPVKSDRDFLNNEA